MGYFAENFDIVLEQVQPINEAYFGKTKEVYAIEKAIHDFRFPYLQKAGETSQFLNIDTYSPKMNSDPNKKKLEKAISNCFGFSEASIDIIQSAQNNAATMPSSFSVDLGSDKLYRSAKKSSSKKTGFKFDKNDGIIFMMQIYAGMFLNKNFTDAELTAILLHEIGHNFSPVAERGCKVAYKFPAIAVMLVILSQIASQIAAYGVMGVKVIVDIPSIVGSVIGNILSSSNAGKKIIITIDDIGDKIVADLEKVSPGFVNFLRGFVTAANVSSEVLGSISYIQGILSPVSLASLPINFIAWIVQSLGRPTGYADEKFADAFPRMYGYGPDFISGLSKLTEESNSTAEQILNGVIPALPALNSVYMLPFYMLSSACDEHPLDIDRFNFALNDVQEELNRTDLSPKTKKIIMQDAKNMKAEYDKYYNNLTKLDKRFGMGIYQKIVQSVFGGSIKSKTKARHVNDDINKFFDEL